MLATDLIMSLTQAGFDVSGFDLPEVDITDRHAVQRAIDDAKPDLVIHTAAMTAVDACEDAVETAMTVNRDGAGNVAAAAAVIGAPIIHISTDYVFNGRGTRPYLEDDTIDPLGVYGRTKAEGEAAVAAANPAYIICRTSWLYGINGKNFVSTILRMAGERDELTIVNDQVGCPTFTGHLSNALAVVSRALLDTSENIRPSLHGIYHTVNSEQCSWHEFAQTILQAAGITHAEGTGLPDHSRSPPLNWYECFPISRPRGPLTRYSTLRKSGKYSA